jgi:rhodanese-related sulfurtransferase
MTIVNHLNDEAVKEWKNSNKFNAEDVILIDIREPDEFKQEYIEGSLNVPTQQVQQTDFSAENHKNVVFLCRSGNRTRTIESILSSTGFKEIFTLTGGIEQWKRCGLPTKK